MNAAFTDSSGTEWKLEINIAMARRMKEEHGIDLDEMKDMEFLLKLHRSRIALGGCLWIVCEKQLERQGMDQDDWLEMLGSGCLDDALEALVGAIVNFTPKSIRPMIEKAWTELEENFTKGHQAILDWNEKHEQERDRKRTAMVTESLEKAFGGLSTS